MAANWRSLGLITVTTAGTPVRITATRTPCHAIMVQAKPTNTGLTYVGTSSLVKATYVGVNAIIGIPTDNSIPSAHAGIPNASDGLNAADYWVDAAVNGEGVIVAILEG